VCGVGEDCPTCPSDCSCADGGDDADAGDGIGDDDDGADADGDDGGGADADAGDTGDADVTGDAADARDGRDNAGQLETDGERYDAADGGGGPDDSGPGAGCGCSVPPAGFGPFGSLVVALGALFAARRTGGSRRRSRSATHPRGSK
jgi:hypothetical protein